MFEEAIKTLRLQLDQLAVGTDPYDKIENEIKDAKAEVINKYGRIFAPDRIPTLTAEEFKSFLLFKNNHHWEGIHRQNALITANMDLLRNALTTLVNEELPIRHRLNSLRPANGEPMVKGLGRAVITAILQVTHPDKYGVLNQAAEDGMKLLGVWPSISPRATFGESYESINSRLLQLAKEIPTDLWTLDMLWWRVQPTVPFGSGMSESIATAQAPLAGEAATPGSGTEPVGTSGQFALEAHLQEFLIENWTITKFGSEWDLYEKDGEIVGSYFNTHEVGQIDLLAQHKSDNRWLVIELKKNQTSDMTVGQLLRYRSWVRENLAKHGEPVLGVIICSDADLKLKYALKGLDNVQCMTYSVHFSLANAELSIAKGHAG